MRSSGSNQKTLEQGLEHTGRGKQKQDLQVGYAVSQKQVVCTKHLADRFWKENSDQSGEKAE